MIIGLKSPNSWGIPAEILSIEQIKGSGPSDVPPFHGHGSGVLKRTDAIHSLKLTQPLKNGGWETIFLLGRPIFKGYCHATTVSLYTLDT